MNISAFSFGLRKLLANAEVVQSKGHFAKVVAQIAPDTHCTFIVGIDTETDELMCKILSDVVWRGTLEDGTPWENTVGASLCVQIFEHDFAAHFETLGALGAYKNAHEWGRHIDDGARSRQQHMRLGCPDESRINRAEGAPDGLLCQCGMLSGSLDQFYFGTGCVPTLVKIGTRESLMPVLHGSVEILRLFRPMLLFRLPIDDEIQTESIEYLAERNYRFFSIEKYAYVRNAKEIDDDDGYVLALHESYAEKYYIAPA